MTTILVKNNTFMADTLYNDVDGKPYHGTKQPTFIPEKNIWIYIYGTVNADVYTGVINTILTKPKELSKHLDVEGVQAIVLIAKNVRVVMDTWRIKGETKLRVRHFDKDMVTAYCTVNSEDDVIITADMLDLIPNKAKGDVPYLKYIMARALNANFSSDHKTIFDLHWNRKKGLDLVKTYPVVVLDIPCDAYFVQSTQGIFSNIDFTKTDTAFIRKSINDINHAVLRFIDLKVDFSLDTLNVFIDGDKEHNNYSFIAVDNNTAYNSIGAVLSNLLPEVDKVDIAKILRTIWGGRMSYALHFKNGPYNTLTYFLIGIARESKNPLDLCTLLTLAHADKTLIDDVKWAITESNVSVANWFNDKEKDLN